MKKVKKNKSDQGYTTDIQNATTVAMQPLQ